ncbi:pentatricopeptide repeat-containing protein [Dorcoceras hygrometricum]|uniref:Pentatricopeptide repeat-containing protein n=1 Tax=Dorcoceras hygrometricum TaxID=472368 RepID=A0A2Z7DKH3_9LAMI|nr:pentatricopeptide repeat-containing protein [Dorcoceras hygrometricum]
MSLFDLQDVRIAIGSLATLDLPMVVDLIGIYGLKGPYSAAAALVPPPPPPLQVAGICSGQLDEENPSAPILSGLLVQADEGVSHLVVDRIDVVYRNLSIFDFRQSSQSKFIEMASTFIANSYQVNFDSVLLISDHDGMLNIFKALEASGLRGFLGCESVLYEKELEQFFDTALIQDGDITGAISGKYFSVSQSQFAEDLRYQRRGWFLKHEYRLLNDILAKALTVKAGSSDAVTNERFQMMTAIHFGLKVNWSKVLFSVLKYMVDRTQKKAKGYAAQIGVLLKSIPAITMGEGVPLPISKILSIQTVNSYIAMNHTIDARGQSDKPGVADVAVVKRKSKSKKKSKTTDETPV